MTFKELRRESGLTQQQLADSLSVTRTAVTMWESTSRAIPAKYLLRLAEVLQCPVEELLKLKDS